MDIKILSSGEEWKNKVRISTPDIENVRNYLIEVIEIKST